MEHHEKWISGKAYFNMDEYYSERNNARAKALESQLKHIKEGWTTQATERGIYTNILDLTWNFEGAKVSSILCAL